MSSSAKDVVMPVFAERFAELQATLHDPDARFSGSQMLEDLLALLPLAQAIGDASPELCRLYAELASLQGKRGDDEEQLRYGQMSLRIDSTQSVLPVEQRLRLHYGVANAAGELEHVDIAIEHLRAAIVLAPADASLDQRQRFGIRQSLGFWLHDSGRFDEALVHNAALLADAQAEFGEDEPELTGILTNLAQNAYELGDFERSEAYLQSCRALAERHGKDDVLFEMLFQLGVLAHERVNSAAALGYFEQRLAFARQQGDEYLMERAQDDLDEFHQREAAGR
jgi:tetratricopeptide (TPR) repeat protein